MAVVIPDSAGNLYGTTEHGGAAGAGVLYELDAAGQETVLYTFTGGADGANPSGNVVLDSAGYLYGTTPNGGDCTSCAVVYTLTADGHFSVLHYFHCPGGRRA